MQGVFQYSVLLFKYFFICFLGILCFESQEYAHYYRSKILQPTDRFDMEYNITRPPQAHAFSLDEPVELDCPSNTEVLKILNIQFPSDIPLDLKDFVRETIQSSCSYHSKCQLSPNQLRDTNKPMGYSQTTILLQFMCLRKKLNVPKLPNSLLLEEIFSNYNRQAMWSKRAKPRTPLQHLLQQYKTFLILQGVTTSCTEISSDKSSYSFNEEAQNRCLDLASCTMIVHDSVSKLCSDTSLKFLAKKAGCTIFLKGSEVLQDLPQDLDFYLFLNQQAICEKENLLREHNNVQSITEAMRLCYLVPHCDYFVMTTESGLSSKVGVSGPLPNHVWLCTQPTKQDTERLTSVALYGTISGFSKSVIKNFGFPILIGVPPSG